MVLQFLRQLHLKGGVSEGAAAASGTHPMPLSLLLCGSLAVITTRKLLILMGTLCSPSRPYHHGVNNKSRVFARQLVLEVVHRKHTRKHLIAINAGFCSLFLPDGPAQVDIPVTLCDERLTSVEARGILKDGGMGESYERLDFMQHTMMFCCKTRCAVGFPCSSSSRA